jgi:uncharacterized membrane protein
VSQRPLTILNWHRQAVVAVAVAAVIILGGVVFVYVHASTSRSEAQARLAAGTTSGIAGGPGEAAGSGLRLCNRTQSRVGVAIGYKANRQWITEGWWNVGKDSCETLVAGTLVSRFYYIYAVDYDRSGVWGGKAVMCTRDKEFTITGIEDCVARGYERSGFFEVDTGEQKSWTVQLTEPNRTAAASGKAG